jgi:hypothetical protein
MKKLDCSIDLPVSNVSILDLKLYGIGNIGGINDDCA